MPDRVVARQQTHIHTAPLCFGYRRFDLYIVFYAITDEVRRLVRAKRNYEVLSHCHFLLLARTRHTAEQ